MRLPAAAALLLLLAPLAPAQTNLLPNPGMEPKPGATLPDGWEPVMIGTHADFAADPTVKHAGTASARITAPDSTRSYFRSPPIPVAPGEKVRCGAWVKFQDVPEKMGTVILIGEWSGPDGKGSEVVKFDVAKRPATSADWQYIEGTQTVPANTANVRVRLGFSYSQGTCWWDDASLTVDSPASLRIDFPTPRVTPALPGLPLTLLNRQSFKGPAKVAIKAGNDGATFDVTLTGQPLQKLLLPLPLGHQKGKIAIEAALSTASKLLATATFDGVIPTPLILPPVSPTHWCVEDGPAQFSGTIDLSASPADIDQAVMTLRVTDKAGKIHATQKWSADDGSLVTGKPSPFNLTLPPNLPLGDYKIQVELKGKETRLAVEQPVALIPRRLARVTLNPAGFPVYDGKAIWPMGIFNGGKFKDQGDAGFTVSHAYNAARVTPGRDPEDQRAKDFIDQSYANNQMAVFMVPLKLAEEGDWDGFRHRIRLFKNHPGLLAWDEEEGLARGDWTQAIRKKAYDIVREEDPNHPFMVGDSRDVISKMGDRSNFFDPTTLDLGMWWWYPFPLIGRGAADLEGEEASTGTTLEPPTFLVKRNTDKPLWVGIQSYKKPGAEGRFPTPTEYRLQAYYAIIEGAKGLMWYGGGVHGGMHLAENLKESHWEDLQKIVKEIHTLDWAWMSPTLDQIEDLAKNTPVSLIAKKGEKGTVIVVANRSAKPQDVTLPATKFSGKAQVIGENRSATFTPQGLKEHLDPYAVHVYLLR